MQPCCCSAEVVEGLSRSQPRSESVNAEQHMSVQSALLPAAVSRHLALFASTSGLCESTFFCLLTTSLTSKWTQCVLNRRQPVLQKLLKAIRACKCTDLLLGSCRSPKANLLTSHSITGMSIVTRLVGLAAGLGSLLHNPAETLVLGVSTGMWSQATPSKV